MHRPVFRTAILVCCLIPAGPPAIQAQDISAPPRDAATRWAALINSDVNQLQERQQAIRTQLQELPYHSTGHSGAALGYHSHYIQKRDHQVSVTVDLQRRAEFDSVALIPAETLVGGRRTVGYGFPVRFRLEVGSGETPATASWQTMVDAAAEDCENPGRLPLVFASQYQGRWIRLTATRLWERGAGLHALALAELMVLSGNRNVAQGCPVEATSVLNAFPTWSLQGLTDGQSPLGMPIVRETSRTNGYHAEHAHTADTLKWVALDLGQQRVIDEVRLVPAHPVDWPRPGYGFPTRFRVEVADNPEFDDPVVLFAGQDQVFPEPGDNVVSIVADGVRGRWVRCVATELFHKGTPPGMPTRYAFALAELQVYSGDQNVAPGCAVTALDTFHFELRPLWDRPYLVDGYGSQNRLSELPEYLSGLNQRRQLLSELAALENQLRDTVERSVTQLLLVAGVVAAMVVGGLLSLLVWSIRQRRRLLREQRERIARDLHDEIGSALWNIRLLSEMATDMQAAPDEIQGDMRQIHQIATNAGEATRDIIWLMNTQHMTGQDLADQFRRLAHEMLADVGLDVRYEQSGEPTSRKLSMVCRRNAMLAFKETLHNVRCHAQATEVRIEVQLDSRKLQFRVEDNGVGLPEPIPTGNGLANISRRAQEMGGDVSVSSNDPQGTVVSFAGRLS